LLQGESLSGLVQEFPAMVWGYKKLKADLEEVKMDLKIDERDDLPAELPNPWGIRMPLDLDNKRCHYWVYSTCPNRGKTSLFLEPIHQKFRAIWKDQREPYWTIPASTEAIIFDEVMSGDFKAGDLNSICDGHKEFRVFQGGCIRLDHKPLVIVCSNYSIKTVFPFQHALVYSRFTEIDVTSYGNDESDEIN